MIYSVCLACRRVYRRRESERPGIYLSHGICSRECARALYPDLVKEIEEDAAERARAGRGPQ